MSRLPSIAAIALLLAATLMPRNAQADGAWLDGPVAAWNTPGMAIPQAPKAMPQINTGCPAGRSPGSPREQAVIDAGWTLYGGFIRGTPYEEMFGLAGYDGMCRPMEYQVFFFVDGVFAGTISPTPMDSRTDGALNGLTIINFDEVHGRYARYTLQDALCCPSAVTTATFKVDRSGSAPLLVLQSLSTEKAEAQPPAPSPSPALPPAPTATPIRAPVQAPAQIPPPTPIRR